MPGIKRKATKDRAAGAAAASSSKAKALKKNGGARKAQMPSSDEEDEASGSSSIGDDDDDFDDGEDLMEAAKSGKYGESSLEEGDDAEGHDMMSDEDMDGGFEDLEDGDGHYEEGDDGEDGAENRASRKRSKGQEALYAPPTNEEMQGLRETGELFKSNILKLQVSRRRMTAFTQ